MDSLIKYAPIEDVIDAFKIIQEQNKENGNLSSSLFGIHNALTFINFGCIKNTDHVFVIACEYEIITWMIAYIYTPNKLFTDTYYFDNTKDIIDWEEFHQLLSGYQYTKPDNLRIDINGVKILQEPFDTAFVGLYHPANIIAEKPNSRFYLELGEEYEVFEKNLIEVSTNLKDLGILVILSKPCWILKAWKLLDDLSLYLDYNNYKLYVVGNRGPNTFVWLRFVKNMKNFGVDVNKGNMLNLMKDNDIDRLFAHKNKLIFPYVELPDYNTEAYVTMDQNTEYMQYFFTVETTRNLAMLCDNFTACLVTPSVAQCAHKDGKNIILFERDNRFRENGGLKYVKYDLYKGLPKLLHNKYLHAFDKVICDPPFNIKLNVLADDIDELLKNNKHSMAYIIFPSKDKASLVNAMKRKCLYIVDESNQISIEYVRPPKIVRINGIGAIQLYKFTYVS